MSLTILMMVLRTYAIKTPLAENEKISMIADTARMYRSPTKHITMFPTVETLSKK